MPRYKVLIWSEFPPKTHTGISLINQLVLNTLLKCQTKVGIIEECAWNKGRFETIIHHFTNYIKLLFGNKSGEYLYFTFPLSRGGILKILIVFPLLRLFRCRTKLVGHIHRGDFPQFSSTNLINQILLKLCFFFLNKTIILSDSFKDSIQQFSKRSKLEVLNNTSPFEDIKLTPKENYFKNYVCIANYIRTKGLKELLLSFKGKNLCDLKLDLFGNTFDKDFEKELFQIKTPNISINHALNREQLQEKLKRYDCLIVPSINEGQPMVILEAMSLGIPVIASKVGDIPNMLGEEYPFFFNPNSENSLQQTIHNFHNYNDKKDISNYLLNRYKRRYSNKIFENTVCSIFR